MKRRLVKLMALGISVGMIFTAVGSDGLIPVYAAEMEGVSEPGADNNSTEAGGGSPDAPADAGGEETPANPDGAGDGETPDGADGEETPDGAGGEDAPANPDGAGGGEPPANPDGAADGETPDGTGGEETPDNAGGKEDDADHTTDVLPEEIIETEIQDVQDADLIAEEIAQDMEPVEAEEETVYRVSADTLIINIRDLGAGNDNADTDTRALQSALHFMDSEEWLRAGGNTAEIKKVRIIIPQGTYYINSALELDSDTEIVAESGAVVHLQQEETVFAKHGDGINFRLEGGTWTGDGKSCLVFEVAGNVELADMVFDGIALDLHEASGENAGNSADASGSNTKISGCTINGGEFGFGIRIRDSFSNVSVENNKLNNVSGNGILVTGANCTVKGNTIEGTNGNAAVYVENTRNFTADSNTVTNTSGRGILAVNTNGVTVTGNKIKKSSKEGIAVVSGCTGQVRIEGNTVEESGMQNISVAGGSPCTIKGNSMMNGSNMGLYVEGIQNASVENNTITGNALQGIVIYRSADAKVTDNRVMNNKSDGILIHTASDKPKVRQNTVTDNSGDGIKTDGISAPEVAENTVRSNNIGIYICRCGDSLINGNTTETNRNKGIYVEGNLNGNGASRDYFSTITGNTVKADRLSGILVFHAKADINKNNVSDTGAGVGEGIVVQYSGDSIISENNISGVKSAEYNNGNGIIVANNSENVIVYKNKVASSGNHGIQVTYSSNNVTVLANDVSGSGHQGITFSRNSQGIIAGNRVLQSKNHGIINENSNVKTGGNYVAGVGEECIAYNSSTGTVKGNVVVSGRVFVVGGRVEQADNTTVPSATDNNPYVTEPKVEDFVKRLYQRVLGREFEQAGLIDWTCRLLVRDESGAQVARGIFFSDEYMKKNTSDSVYVDTLYSAMFDRAADEGGKKGWMKDFDTGFSREFVYHGFAESQEFQNLCNRYGIERGYVTMNEGRDKNRGVTEFVSRIYTKALSRKKVDSDGLNDWCNRILTGTSPKDVVAGFIFSDEFTNRKLSNEAFIKVMYETYFDRQADTAGFNDWMDRMDKGASRQDVVNGFSESQEFDNLIKSFGL